jgi:hypothetical protein
MIFNLGAPSQQDLWDMKPDAPSEIRGPFKPIRTKSNAFEISEILPLHAKIADKFSLVRSCYHTAAAVHDTGSSDDADGPTFHRWREHAARRQRSRSSSKAAAAICPRTSSCRKRWDPPAATCRTARTRASSARRMILSS